MAGRKPSSQLECPICFELFETTDSNKRLPRNFPCAAAHTICTGCLSTLAQQAAPRCPTCREPPVFDIKVPRTNSALLALLEQLHKDGDAPVSSTDAGDAKGVAPLCELCEENPAKLHCETCQVDHCESCSGTTHKPKKMQTHKIVPWSPAAVKKSAAAAAGVDLCKLHEEKLRLFCMQCNVPICVVCKESEKHEGHKTKPVGEVVEQIKLQLLASARTAQQTVRDLEAESKRLAGVGAQEAKDVQDAEAAIKAEIARLRQALNSREQELLTKLKQISKVRLHPVESARESLVMALSLGGALCEEVDRAVKKGDFGVLAAKQSIDAKLNSLKNSSQDCLAKPLQFVGCPVVFSPAAAAAIASHGTVGAAPAPRIVDCQPSGGGFDLAWQLTAAAVGKFEFAVEASQVQQASAADRADAKAGERKQGLSPGAAWAEVYRGSELKAEIKNLAPDTRYQLRVRVRDDRGWSAWSEPVGGKTPATGFIGSQLLQPAQEKQLLEWVGGGSWRLLYRGSRDGFQAAKFHQLCDKKGTTTTIIRSTNGNLFGAHTPLEWGSNDGDYVNDASGRTFLFSLVNATGQPLKLQNAGVYGTNQQSIYDDSSCGPTFGGGHDLLIADGCNGRSNSYSRIGHDFAAPPGTSFGTDAAQSFFAGSRNFTVSEIEVFARA